MNEDDILELLWKSGQVVGSSHTQSSTLDPSPILRGSGSGGGEGHAPPLLPPPLYPSHQNLFIQEDEKASWLHHPLSQDFFSYEILNSSTPAVSLAPPPPPPPLPPPGAIYDEIIPTTRTENFMHFWRLRGNIYNGGRSVEAGQSTQQVGSSATPSSSATNFCVIPAVTEGNESRVSHTFAVPRYLNSNEEAVAVVTETVCDIAGTEPIQIQPAATETEIADDRKRKEREETEDDQDIEEAGGSTSRKRSRAAEMHNLSERRRRERINDKMKALQELIPRCHNSDKASMLDDAIEYVKSLQIQIQMMSMGHGRMPPPMYAGNMQQFMPHMAMGMMGMNRPPPFIPFPGTPFSRAGQMAGPSYPAPRYSFPNIQTFYPSRAHLQSPQPNQMSNQPQFPAYMDPYGQFVGLHQMQHPPPPMQSQTTSQLSFSQPSSSKEPEDQGNQITG